ncbi:hypothetical protein CVIRNUC_008574 [Coccomyxa viridis]|uniref:dolichol kinase n=1 Tax=Coccomyxa viridis TaxID=1274662 RepID=A0AAV1IEZ4_9CHLO|nr:hypothetical protein CVIRNUC_008574 [Coccomyxa viridis]
MKREACEALLLVCTFARLATGFWKEDGTLPSEILGLGALTILSLAQELSTIGSRQRYGYITRRADSEGVALGALSVPWACTGLILMGWRYAVETGYAEFALQASVAGCMAMVAFLAWCVVALSRQHSRPPISKYALIGPEQTSIINSKLAEASSLRHRACTNGKLRDTKGVDIDAVAGPKDRRRRAKAPGNAAMEMDAIAAANTAVFAMSVVACIAMLVAGMERGVLGGALQGIGLVASSGMAVCILHALLTCLPLCFTIGEAMVVAQAAALLLWDVCLLAISFLTSLTSPGEGLSEILRLRSGVGLFVELLVFGALVTAVPCVVLLRTLCPQDAASRGPVSPRKGRSKALSRRQKLLAGAALAAVLALAVAAAVRPALWALGFAFARWRRIALLGYWVALLAAALPLMDWVSRRRKVPTIIVRKGYHILALGLFTPALLVDPQLLAMSMAIAAALLVVVEVVRMGNVPYLGPKIHEFMTSFIDSRDAGALLVSHFSLLAGMAAPVWVSAVSSTPVGACVPALSTTFSGIMVLGIADSAASAIGRRFGRRRLLGTRKTLEGTLGAILCTVVGWLVLWPMCRCRGHENLDRLSKALGAVERLGHGRIPSQEGMKAAITERSGGVAFWSMLAAAVASCMLEATTTQLDNIFLPLHHYAMLLA